MITAAAPFRLHASQAQCPYKDLFIYYLQGRITPGGPAFEGLIGNWEEQDTSFLFFSVPALEQVERLLTAQPQLALVDHFQMSYDQWQGDLFEPLQVGRFRVSPPWAPRVPADTVGTGTMLPLMLDPGVVFGTGTHPTTRDCLAALELAWDRLPAKTVLDLGTGSGLLAIAAALLGARRVLAIDINLLAVRTAARNILLNNLQNRIVAVQGKAEDFIHQSADMIIANIHFEIMEALIGSRAFSNGQRFILSGLLRTEAKQVETRLHQTGARILRQWSHEGTWHTFYGQTTVT